MLWDLIKGFPCVCVHNVIIKKYVSRIDWKKKENHDASLYVNVTFDMIA